jgi:hypothetical protein
LAVCLHFERLQNYYFRWLKNRMKVIFGWRMLPNFIRFRFNPLQQVDSNFYRKAVLNSR